MRRVYLVVETDVDGEETTTVLVATDERVAHEIALNLGGGKVLPAILLEGLPTAERAAE